MRISLARLRMAAEEKKKKIIIFLKEDFQINLIGGIQPPIIGQETGAPCEGSDHALYY